MHIIVLVSLTLKWGAWMEYSLKQFDIMFDGAFLKNEQCYCVLMTVSWNSHSLPIYRPSLYCCNKGTLKPWFRWIWTPVGKFLLHLLNKQTCPGVYYRLWRSSKNRKPVCKTYLKPKVRLFLVPERRRWERVAKVEKSIGLSPLT